MIRKIAHVGIATGSIGATAEFYRKLGLDVESIEVVEDQGVRLALLRVGDSAIELLEPVDEHSPIHRFLEKRGPGMHHLTLEVTDLRAQLDRLKAADIRLIDEEPRGGAGGSLIAFIHPESTGGVLVELCQESGGEQS